MSEDWRRRARCGSDPELFFPVGKTGPALVQRRRAKAVCARCPVISDCRAWALENPTMAAEGIWGGTDEDERRALRERTQRTEVRAR